MHSTIPRMTSTIIIASGHLCPRLTELTGFLLAAILLVISFPCRPRRNGQHLPSAGNSENTVPGCAACVKQYDLAARRCPNCSACATAAGNAVRLRWCRPRHQRRRCPAPTAGTVRTPGTFGISAWLLRSEAKRHLRCREERTGRDPRRGRRRRHASPYPRGPVAAGEGPGSRYSSRHATFPPRGPRPGSALPRPGYQGFRAAEALPSPRTPIFTPGYPYQLNPC